MQNYFICTFICIYIITIIGNVQTHKYVYYLCMNIDLIHKLTKNKDKRVTMMFNNELWDMFKNACEKENSKPTPEFEKFMLKFLENKGLL